MLIEHSLQGIAVIQGAPLRFVFVNSSWANIFGYTLNELTSLSAKEIEGLVYPEYRAMVFERFAGRLKGKSVLSHYEIRGLRKDGAVIWLELSASQIEFNGQPAVQVEAIDRTRYKKAETELFENNMRLQNILAASPDAITITDLRGNIVDCNQAAVSLGGFSSREELIGKSALELMAKRDHQRAMENLKVTAEKGLLRNVPYTLMRKDGHEYPAELSAGVVRDAQGNLVGFVAILRDITERQKAEEALKQSEEKYRVLVEDSLQGIVIAQGIPPRFVFANRMMAMKSGYTVDELLSFSPEKFESTMHPESRAEFFKLYKDCLEGKPMSQPFEFRGIGKNGAASWAEISFRRIEYDGQPAVQAVFVDVNERKKAEDALRESEEKLRNTIESSPEAITLIDMNGKVVDCNQAALEMFGYAEKEEMVGEDGFAVISSKDRARVMEDLTALPQKGSIKNIGVRMVAKDGREFVAEASANLVRDAAGNPKYVVTLVRDITERKQMEQKLEEYSQQLEEMVEYRTKQLKDTQERLVKSERLAAIGQVAAMVGHDLRNPLTGIIGAAYYLKMKLGPKVEKRMIQMLEIIEKDIQYSNKIITDLMDYSREMKLELTETTPKSIIAESISLIQIPEKVQLADSTLNEPKIKIDIDKMKRVFANFVKNAVEAMPQGGKLTISSRGSSNNVEFMLIDSGVGMAKEVSEKIWTPFFTTKAKGMGLGLAICRRIIEAHQGKISVESIFGEGTTFTITIPIEPRIGVEGGERVWVNMPESLLSTTTKA